VDASHGDEKEKCGFAPAPGAFKRAVKSAFTTRIGRPARRHTGCSHYRVNIIALPDRRREMPLSRRVSSSSSFLRRRTGAAEFSCAPTFPLNLGILRVRVKRTVRRFATPPCHGASCREQDHEEICAPMTRQTLPSLTVKRTEPSNDHRAVHYGDKKQGLFNRIPNDWLFCIFINFFADRFVIGRSFLDSNDS
jgi:hypothetical protein